MNKELRILFLAATAMLGTATFALAARAPAPAPLPTTSTVAPGGIATITVLVKNASTSTTLPGTVNITGTDSTGRIVANMGVPVVVAPKKTITITRTWTAPKYTTALAWKAKLVTFREAPISHQFGWLYPKLQHRMTLDSKNPVTCLQCHNINVIDKKAPMNCYNCHAKKWN